MSRLDTIMAQRIVPVVEIDDAAHAVPLADALTAGGLPVVEITFRTAAAADAIAAIAQARPAMAVGAGTVLDTDQLDRAQAAGARFALSPGLDLAVVARARSLGMPFVPGILTPSELQAALAAGCGIVKFFPATAAGGPPMLKAMAAPFAHTGIAFNPTGGITVETLPDWLALPAVRAVGGTWIAPRKAIAQGDWDGIANRARAAVAAAGRVAHGRGATGQA